MILELFGELNWLAVVVATVAWFAFSAIWYSIPPLSQAWATAAGVDTTGDGPPLALLFIPTLIGYFVTTIVIGFGMVGALVNQVYESKGSAYFLINGLNSVIAFAIVGAVLAVWD